MRPLSTATGLADERGHDVVSIGVYKLRAAAVGTRRTIGESGTDESVSGKSPEAFRTIGEVAESLDLPQHVLRFWETRFAEIEPVKGAGGRRYYRPRDVELVAAIRQLLYGEGYTIRGVQRLLKEQGARAVIESARGAGRSVEPTPGEARDAQPNLPFGESEAESREQASPEPTESAAPANAVRELARTAPPAPAPRDDRAELAPLAAVALGGGARGLAAGDVERLRAALADLAECRRLLALTRR